MKRLRLVHQVFLVLAAVAIMAEFAIAGALTLDLRQGFRQYLVARDVEQLDELVSIAEERIAVMGRGRPPAALGQMVVSVLAKESRMPMPLAQGRRADRPPPRWFDWLVGGRPPRREPRERRHPPPEFFGARLAIFDAAGSQLLGPPPPAKPVPGKIERRTVKFDGRVVAVAMLLPRGSAAGPVDAAFLNRQLQNALLIMGLLLAISAAAAYAIASRLARGLGTVQRATQDIAQGAFDTRIEERGAREVVDTIRNINQMASALERLEAARRRWLAEVSHELRTPLSALRGEIDAILDGVRPCSPDAVRSLDEEVRRLVLLTDDLHFLAMADLDAVRCRFVATDAVALGETAVERFASVAASKGLTLSFVSPGEAVLPVAWDVEKIERLLANLLFNSIRYTDAPGLVELRMEQSGQSVMIIVQDSPPAVGSAHLQLMFDPLYRVEAARDRGSGGSGLGLAIVKAIAEAHHGSVRGLVSPLGGLRVEVALPKDPSEQ